MFFVYSPLFLLVAVIGLVALSYASQLLGLGALSYVLQLLGLGAP